MPSTLEELARICDARLSGDSDCKIVSINTLKAAKKGDIAFLSNRRYATFLSETSASAVILKDVDVEKCPTNALIVDDPYVAYAMIANHLYPGIACKSGINESVIIGNDCDIDETVSIAANVSIGNNVTIGANTNIAPGCCIEDNVCIGKDVSIMANVTLCFDVVLGNSIIIYPGAVIGSDGFGYAQTEKSWLKIPQIGSVIIKDGVEIGANTTIDRGAIDDTVIHAGVKIDNLVQIGHNVVIDENTVIAGCTAIAGSTTIGKRCMIGGSVGISGHITITDDVIITGKSGVSNSISSAGVYSSGIPVTENKIWRRNVVRFKHLDELIQKIMNKLN